MSSKLVIFIRCHAYPEFIIDTIDSIKYYSTSNPLLVCTIDSDKSLVPLIQKAHPDVLCYVTKIKCKWGGSLWEMLCEALIWLIEVKKYSFDYVLNLDYDLIYTNKIDNTGPDEYYLRFFTAPNIGQVGKLISNSPHWSRKMRLYTNSLVNLFAKNNKKYPITYRPGIHCAGAYSYLKYNTILEMYSQGFLRSPFSNIHTTFNLADDPLLSFFVISAGYRLSAIDESRVYIKWIMTEDYKTIPSRNYAIYHPTKLSPGNLKCSIIDELNCRNFFRSTRNQEPIPFSSYMNGYSYPT